MPTAAQILRLLIFGSGTALFVTFAAWSYSAAVVGDIVTAAVTIFLAWLVSVCTLGLSEVFGAFEKTKKLYINIGFAVLMALFSGALFYYFYQHRPEPPASTAEGARIFVTPAPPISITDGKFYMPVRIDDIGDRPVEGYILQFSENLYQSQLDASGEREFKKSAEMALEATIRSRGITVDTIGNGSSLTTKTGATITNPTLELTPEQMAQIKAGQSYLYYDLVIVFSDETSKKDNKLYFAEHCMFYNAKMSSNTDCLGGGITRAVYHSFKEQN